MTRCYMRGMTGRWLLREDYELKEDKIPIMNANACAE